VPEETPDVWREILREAIAVNPPPLLGTHFRSAVNLAVAKREAPPVEESGLRFIQLLERYPDVISVLRRPGQDFLVAPAEKKDLLAKRVQDHLFGIRHDLFQAFTTISENRPYYDKTADRVVWQEVEEGQTVPDTLVPIEPATSETEAKLRHDFAEKMQEPLRSQLLKTLEDHWPLQAFGKKVKDLSLQTQWHSFRTELVVQKMQRWASEYKIDWKDAWLTPGRIGGLEKERSYLATRTQSSRLDGSRTEHDALHLLFSGLDAADIQRIAIPLDLVLKVLSATKR